MKGLAQSSVLRRPSTVSHFQSNHLPNPPQIQMIAQQISQVIKIFRARIVGVRRQRREAFVFTQPVEIGLPKIRVIEQAMQVRAKERQAKLRAIGLADSLIKELSNPEGRRRARLGQRAALMNLVATYPRAF